MQCPIFYIGFLRYSIFTTLENTFQPILDWFSSSNRKLPEPKDIREFEKDFNFEANADKTDLAKDLENLKFAEMIETKTCDLYEDQPKNSLFEIMSKIGKNNNISDDLIEIMKLSIDGGRAIKAHEMFAHGK